MSFVPSKKTSVVKCFFKEIEGGVKVTLAYNGASKDFIGERANAVKTGCFSADPYLKLNPIKPWPFSGHIGFWWLDEFC